MAVLEVWETHRRTLAKAILRRVVVLKRGGGVVYATAQGVHRDIVVPRRDLVLQRVPQW